MNEKEISPAQAQSLQIIAAAMGLGIFLLCGVVVFNFFTSAKAPTPEMLRMVNLLTGVTMAVTAATIVVSEILWKVLLKPGPSALSGAFIARTACREGGALLGCVTALIAAMSGVLRVYPAYWANLAPAALFWSYLYLHWPSVANLQNELS